MHLLLSSEQARGGKNTLSSETGWAEPQDRRSRNGKFLSPLAPNELLLSFFLPDARGAGSWHTGCFSLTQTQPSEAQKGWHFLCKEEFPNEFPERLVLSPGSAPPEGARPLYTQNLLSTLGQPLVQPTLCLTH